MKKIAVFPGSFDPVTKGHEAVINRAALLFDEVVVALGKNTNKNYHFKLEQRLEFLHSTFESEKNVKVITFEGLTVDLCKKIGARYLVRGLRNSTDFNYERNIALMNNVMDSEVETVFLLTNPEFAAINSTIVREIYKTGGDIRPFVPDKLKLP